MCSLKTSLTLVSIVDLACGLYFVLRVLLAFFVAVQMPNNMGLPEEAFGASTRIVRIARLFSVFENLLYLVGCYGLLAAMRLDHIFAQYYFKGKMVLLSFSVAARCGVFALLFLTQDIAREDEENEEVMADIPFVFARSVAWWSFVWYTALIAKAFFIRLERGEKILVEHGPGIAGLVEDMKNQTVPDVEMAAVSGIPIHEDEFGKQASQDF